MSPRAARRRLLLAGSSAALCAWLQPARAAAAAEGGAAPRLLRFTLGFSNPGGEALADQVLWLYAPMADTPTQHLLRVDCALPHTLSSDTLGHSVLRLPLPVLPPYATKLVPLAFEVAMRAEPQPSPLADPAPWLKAERWIEVDDARVQAAAAPLRRATPAGTARAVYDEVRRRLQYAGYVADDLGALQALQQGRGDCTEYAGLAVALARANGVPARRVGGYVTDGSAAPRAEDYHDWAEVHVDGAWRLLDAQKEHWRDPAQQYVAFRIYRDEAINPLGLAHRFRVDGRVRVRM